jgi:hydrogenase maturation protein HypF
VVEDVQNGMTIAEVSAKFHLTVIRLFADLCDVIRKDRDLDRVVLSGGCFQNATLLTGLIQALQKKIFRSSPISRYPPMMAELRWGRQW